MCLDNIQYIKLKLWVKINMNYIKIQHTLSTGERKRKSSADT